MKLDAPLGGGYGCAHCGRVFGGLTGFDRHQQLTPSGLVCHDPASRGMAKKPNGRWSVATPVFTRKVTV